jgi:hypothetical protein
MNGKIKIIILEDDPATGMKEALDFEFPNVKFQIISSIKELLTFQDIGEADIFIFDIDMSKDTEKIGVGEIKGQDTKIGGIIMALYYLIKRNTYLDKDCIIYTVTGRDDELRNNTNYGGIYNLCKLIYESLGFKIETGEKNYTNAIKYTLKELAENLKKNFVLLNWNNIINIYNNARDNNNINNLLNECLSLRSKHSGKIRNILIGSLFSFCENNEQINAIGEFIIKTAHKGEIVRRLYEKAHGELHKGNRYIINRSYQDDLKSIFDEDAINIMTNLSNNSEKRANQEELIKTYFNERAEFINNYIGNNDDNDARTEKILKLFFRIPLISYIIHRNMNMVIEKKQNIEELYIYGNSINTLKLLDEILDDYNDKLSINLKDQGYCQSVILIFSSNKPHDNFNLYINCPQGGSLNNIKKLVPEIANGLYLFNKKGKEITLYDLFKENNEELSTSGLRNYLNFNDEDCKALILVIDYAKHTQAPLTLEGNN